MKFWMVLWQICLVGTFILFAIVAVVVTIGGFLDVRKLLRRLDEQPEEEPFTPQPFQSHSSQAWGEGEKEVLP